MNALIGFMKKNYRLFLIFSVALVLRIGYVVVAPPDATKTLYGDALGYHTIAVNIISGQGYSMEPGIPTPLRAPGYPFFLAIIYFVFGQNLFAVSVIQAVIGSLICVIAYLLAEKVFSRDNSLLPLAGWVMVFYPVFYAYNTLILTEVLFTFLLGVSVLFLIKEPQGWWSNLSGGIFMGLTALVRPTVIIMPLLFIVGDLWVILRDKNFFLFKKILLRRLIFVAAFVAVIFPWMFRNYRTFGYFRMASTGLGYGFYTSGRMSEGLSDVEALEDYLRYRENYFTASAHRENFKVASGGGAFEFEDEAQRKGMNLIRENFIRYVFLVMKRCPRFWITSHSSVFGVDRSLSEYWESRNYFPIFVRFALMGAQGFLVVSALLSVGFAIFWPDKIGVSVSGEFLYLVMIVAYFTGHIFFDPCPRYHLPAMLYVIVIAAPFIKYLSKKIKIYQVAVAH